MTWTISLPLRVPVTKKKLWSLNLNQFRNTHFQTLNKAKVNFEKQVKPLLRGIPKLDSCSLEYTVWAPNRQLCDTNNICSIVDKFFSDTLVACGVIEDDNYNVVVDSRFRFGGIDKGNPRVDVIIRSPNHPSLVPEEPIQEKKEYAMQIKTVITMSEADLAKALRTALSGVITIPEDAKLSFSNLDAGSDLEITIEAGSPPAPAAKPTSPPVATKTTPKAPPAPVVLEAEPEQKAETSPETPPAAPSKSLFSGMTKPKN